MLPVMMLCYWLFVFATRGFNWISTITFFGFALLWFFLYPARFDRRLQRYAEKTIDEGSYSKSLGPCELTLSESGLHSKTNSGESTFYWSAVDRVLLTDSYCFMRYRLKMSAQRQRRLHTISHLLTEQQPHD
jgi:hypothetical protein